VCRCGRRRGGDGPSGEQIGKVIDGFQQQTRPVADVGQFVLQQQGVARRIRARRARRPAGDADPRLVGIRIAGQTLPPRIHEKIVAQGLGFVSVVTMDDRIALGAYQAVADAGLRIPDDLSVLAFEGSSLARWLRPQLTTVDRQLRTMGQRAIEQLLAPELPQGITQLPMELRVRQSA